MTAIVPVVRTVSDVRRIVEEWKQDGHRVGIVPTMGALHDGHLSLVQAISAHADRIIVSIFVNPTQFGAGEDLDSYPRTEGADRQKLATTAASLVFAPTAAEMYPKGFETTVRVHGLSDVFEGAKRPGHFDGVATVVSKLLLQSSADVAIFGEKDYQQLCVIRRFVADLNIPTTILGGALFREKDGLASSSRNAYLSPSDRKTAIQLNVCLQQLVQDVTDGMPPRQAEQKAKDHLIHQGFQAVDYINVVDCDTLDVLEHHDRPARVLAVARLGGVRLLDNMAIPAPRLSP